MLHKSKKISLSLSLCVMSVLLTPVLTQADTAMVLAEAETGSVAARQAAEQKAALAKKAAEREARKAAEREAKKAAKTQTPANKASETQAPAEAQQEN